MKANHLAYLFLCLLFVLSLEGCGQKKDFAQANHSQLVGTTNDLAAGKIDLVKKFTDTKVKAEHGDAKAQYELGKCYDYGEGVATNLAEAVKWYRKAADQNYARAQFILGICYDNGQGVTRDGVEAVKWYRKAAEQGDADAEKQLSLKYFYGGDVPKNNAEAVKWFEKSAEQGDAEKQNEAGNHFSWGIGVPQDYTKAVKWYLKAAEKGNADAQESLGRRYLTGKGVAQNYTEAVKWFHKAAEQDDHFAEDALGNCYAGGNGVMLDYTEAAKWYRKAAEQGNPCGQFDLGMSYENGEGVVTDYVEAYKWLNLAAAQGYPTSSQQRDYVAQQMTPGQIAEAQQLSREFRPKKQSGSDNSTSPDSPTASGSGFFITGDGYLISNYHVVKDATKVRLLTGVGLIAAKVVQVDAANDLALLKVEGKFSPLPISSSRSAQLGGTVATVGFPDIGLQGFSPKLAKGEIASLSGASDDPRYFQVSLPVQPGNSGGALVDERGNVIGIVSAKLNAAAALAASGALPENVNYAVKSSFLLSFLESVPAVSAKLKAPNTKDEKFEDVVKSAQDAAVLVLVY